MQLLRLTLPVAAAALLATAPTALADTRVSIEDGPFASGQDGKHVLIRDIKSVTHNEPLDVTATRNDTTLFVRDDAGELVADAPCDEVGAEVRCPLSGVLGLRFEGSQLSDVLTNDTDLLAAYRGGDGNDDLFGGSGRDELVGDLGNDLMEGRAGDDVFIANGVLDDGADDLVGGTGIDTANYGPSDDAVVVDLLTNGGDEDGDDVRTENVVGSSQFGDVLRGSSAANILNGSGGNDTLSARDGDDRLVGGVGRDVLTGGNGVDSAEYQDRTAGVTVSIDGEADDGNASDSNGDNVGISVEVLRGGSGDDELVARLDASVANLLDGNGGEDELDGGPGDDLLDGGDAFDDLSGGDGADVLVGREGSDSLSGDGGDDRLDGAAGRDTLNGGNGVDVLTGGDDDDRLNGNTDDDRLFGGPDNDTLDGETGSDEISGDDGLDEVSYEGRLDALTITLDSGVADDGGASDGAVGQRDTVTTVERATGGQFDDVIVGDADSEQLLGGNGDDILVGNDGDDKLFGGNHDDLLDGGAGHDTLEGNSGTDAFSGGLGNDVLRAHNGELDEPISCGEDEDNQDIDELFADPVDVIAQIPDCEATTVITP